MLIDGAIFADCPLVSENGKIPPIPAFATHDEQRIAFAKNYAEKARLPKQALEFQMLYGIRRELQENLAAEGYPVRVYVPYGSEWYPYYTRRLAERPANVWFFISNFSGDSRKLIDRQQGRLSILRFLHFETQGRSDYFQFQGKFGGGDNIEVTHVLALVLDPLHSGVQPSPTHAMNYDQLH
jgi:hypothetical protein